VAEIQAGRNEMGINHQNRKVRDVTGKVKGPNLPGTEL
jgi:hypothetical protein